VILSPVRRLAAAVLAAAGTLLAASLAAAPAAVPAAPERWVTDTAGFLSEAARRSLDQRLEAYERQTGHQVLVWIGRTTGDTPLDDFAVRAFKEWKPGRKGLDDGLALFVLADDRKIRFEVGYGLEDRIPDLVASRIIREVMAPRIQAGDRDGAVKGGVEAALAAIEGRPVPGEGGARPPSREHRPSPARALSTGQKVLIGLAVIGFLILLITNPSLAMWLLLNVLSGGRGGGGGGGGGGYSGGGGRSGGGGASGSW
jgi:uncharacterized protein